MDADTRRKLERAMAGMDLLATLICVAVAVAFLVATMSLLHRGLSKREALRRNGPVYPYITTFCIATVFATPQVSLALIYFGIPKALTFGYQIGKIAPASCAASLEVEGREGTPCSLKRFGEWLHHVAQGDGSLHLEEFERLWAAKMVEAMVMMGVLLALFLFFRWAVRQDEKRMDREDAEGMMEKGM